MDTVVKYIPLALLAIIWELVVRLGFVSPDVLPPFSAVISAGYRFLLDPRFYNHAAISLFRALSGFGLACLIGAPLGIFMASSSRLEKAIGPILQIIYPMPKSALIPIVIIWFGIGSLSKIVLIFLGCLLPVVISAYNGARGVPRDLLWSARSMGVNGSRLMWDVVVPGAAVSILSGCRMALATCFVLLISSELLIAQDGLGYLIGTLGEAGVFPGMFAIILIVVAIGFTTDRLFLTLSNSLTAWTREA
jgi:NitT/TauT family transport system permease protein